MHLKNVDQHGNEVEVACLHDPLLLETMPISGIGHLEIGAFHEVVILIRIFQPTGEMTEAGVGTIGPEMTGHEMIDGVATVEMIGATTGITRREAAVDPRDMNDLETEKGQIVMYTEDRMLGLMR